MFFTDLRHLSHYVVTIHPNTLLCGSEGKEIIAFRVSEKISKRDQLVGGTILGMCCVYKLSVE